MTMHSRFAQELYLLCVMSLSTTFCCDAGQQLFQGVFSLTLKVPGAYISTPIHSRIECGVLCSSQIKCRSFGFSEDLRSCWLYDHQVEYTTNSSTVALGSRYFWRLSPRCPTELGYSLEQGVCFKVYVATKDWRGAKEQCRSDQGHLFIGNTQWKRDLVLGKYTDRAWMGATDESKEGEWRWFNGDLLPVGTSDWDPNEPNNHGGAQHYLEYKDYGKLEDGSIHSLNPYICQVEVQG